MAGFVHADEVNVTNGAIGLVRGGDVSLTNGGAIAMLAGGDVSLKNGYCQWLGAGDNATLQQAGASLVAAGNDMSLTKGGGALLAAGNQLSLQYGGGLGLVAGKAEVRNSYLGLLVAGKATIGENSRVLFGTKEAIIFAAVLAVLLRLFGFVGRGGKKKK